MKRSQSLPRRALAWCAAAFVFSIGLCLAYVPWRQGLWVGRRLGDLAWLVLPGRRRVSLDNLRRAFGREVDEPDLCRLCRRHFQHLGMNMVESCVFFFRPTPVILSRVEVEGYDRLEAALSRGLGVLLLTAHFGNWELLAASHTLKGFGLSVVVRPLDSPILNRIVERFRIKGGFEIINKRRAFREVVAALKRGHGVGILLDQNATRSEGVFAPFFGIPASTSKGLALMALRTGAPVVPVFIRRLPSGRHRIDVSPEVERPPDGDVVGFTAAFNQAIEVAIRRAPEQWFWLHKRWKTRPLSPVAGGQML